MVFVNFVKANYDVIIAVISALASVVYSVVMIIRNRKRIKNAKTDEERSAIIEDIKSEVYAFISIAESLFADIPKSGSSKLLYVLNQVKRLCAGSCIEYDGQYWTDFINGIVGKSNEVIDQKDFEEEKNRIIENVKTEIPYMVKQADDLFATIPDNLSYKIEYILKFIATACDKYPINVYAEYDWRGYVIGLYSREEQTI